MTNAAGRSQAVKYSSTCLSVYIKLTLLKMFLIIPQAIHLSYPFAGHLLLQFLNQIIVSSYQLSFKLSACIWILISYTGALKYFSNNSKNFNYKTLQELKEKDEKIDVKTLPKHANKTVSECSSVQKYCISYSNTALIQKINMTLHNKQP